MSVLSSIESWWRNLEAEAEPDIAKLKQDVAAEMDALKADVAAEVQALKARALGEVQAHGPQVESWVRSMLAELEKAVQKAMTKH